jgi:hypothetical protein
MLCCEALSLWSLSAKVEPANAPLVVAASIATTIYEISKPPSLHSWNWKDETKNPPFPQLGFLVPKCFTQNYAKITVTSTKTQSPPPTTTQTHTYTHSPNFSIFHTRLDMKQNFDCLLSKRLRKEEITYTTSNGHQVTHDKGEPI